MESIWDKRRGKGKGRGGEKEWRVTCPLLESLNLLPTGIPFHFSFCLCCCDLSSLPVVFPVWSKVFSLFLCALPNLSDGSLSIPFISFFRSFVSPILYRLPTPLGLAQTTPTIAFSLSVYTSNLPFGLFLREFFSALLSLANIYSPVWVYSMWLSRSTYPSTAASFLFRLPFLFLFTFLFPSHIHPTQIFVELIVLFDFFFEISFKNKFPTHENRAE